MNITSITKYLIFTQIEEGQLKPKNRPPCIKYLYTAVIAYRIEWLGLCEINSK